MNYGMPTCWVLPPCPPCLICHTCHHQLYLISFHQDLGGNVGVCCHKSLYDKLPDPFSQTRRRVWLCETRCKYACKHPGFSLASTSQLSFIAMWYCRGHRCRLETEATDYGSCSLRTCYEQFYKKWNEQSVVYHCLDGDTVIELGVGCVLAHLLGSHLNFKGRFLHPKFVHYKFIHRCGKSRIFHTPK